MSEGVKVEGLEELQRLAEAYRNGDKALRSEIGKALRSVANPIAKETLREGAERLPKRGGLSRRVAAGRGSASVRLAGRTQSVSIRLNARPSMALGPIDEGKLRHPVYGHGVWVSQEVPARAFTDAFEKKEPEARQAMIRAINEALNTIAREA